MGLFLISLPLNFICKVRKHVYTMGLLSELVNNVYGAHKTLPDTQRVLTKWQLPILEHSGRSTSSWPFYLFFLSHTCSQVLALTRPSSEDVLSTLLPHSWFFTVVWAPEREDISSRKPPRFSPVPWAPTLRPVHAIGTCFQGPEHSSARPERFLQMSNDDSDAYPVSAVLPPWARARVPQVGQLPAIPWPPRCSQRTSKSASSTTATGLWSTAPRRPTTSTCCAARSCCPFVSR